jgi:hypothetical protein
MLGKVRLGWARFVKVGDPPSLIFLFIFTGSPDFLAFVVRIPSQMRMRDFNAWSAQNITALTIAKAAMKVQTTNTKDTKCCHLAQGKLVKMYALKEDG